MVGIYYVAQNVASLPAKLKTSFDPILAPVITQKLSEGDKVAVARQVRQVGFWVIAAQAGIALALGIPGEAVMGLVGPAFVAGTAALAFLLFAEVVAATAAVSEAAPVPEVPHPGEHHRQPRFVGGGDHLVVADRAARLDHRGRARLGRGQQAVGEGEEGVRGDRAADGARLAAQP
jgi:hypothetical protein